MIHKSKLHITAMEGQMIGFEDETRRQLCCNIIKTIPIEELDKVFSFNTGGDLTGVFFNGNTRNKRP